MKAKITKCAKCGGKMKPGGTIKKVTSQPKKRK
jgi:hypothetical protein